MSEHPPDRLWSGIDIVKIIAGTLAAVSAAVIGSFLGVAGTLIGAAVASLVGGLGTELYAKSLQRGVSRIKGAPVQPPVTAPAAVGTPPVAKPLTDGEGPGHFEPVPQPAGAKARRPRWRWVAVPAVAFFVLAMGAVFAIESVAGESLASMFGKETARSSTIGTVLNSGPAAQPRDKPGTGATTDPSASPDGSEPTGAPTGTPAPDATPTGNPAGSTTQPQTTEPVDPQQPATGGPTTGPGGTDRDPGVDEPKQGADTRQGTDTTGGTGG